MNYPYYVYSNEVFGLTEEVGFFVGRAPQRVLVNEFDFRGKYRTEICRNWELGSCEFGKNCAFAHGVDELRNKISVGANYKTKKCKQFHEVGFCIYGNRCQFKHRDTSTDTAPCSPKATKKCGRKEMDDSGSKRLKVFIEIEKKGEYFL